MSTKTKASKSEKKEPGKTKKRMLTPKDVAEYFLKLSEPEVGDAVSNKQIQNLLYYAQGYSLALYNKPLFKDDFVVGMYGPVIKKLYDYYKKLYWINALPYPTNLDVKKFTKAQIQVIEQVHKLYGQFCATKLVDMVNKQIPIMETKAGEIIPKELIKHYFYIQIKYNELKNKKS